MSAPSASLQLHHDVVALDFHRYRLGNVRPLHHARSRLDMRGISLHAEAARVAVGLAGADVELPAMPGAANDLAELGIFDLARILRLREPDQGSLAQRSALMRAAVHQAEIFTLDVENCDRPSVDLQKFSRAGRKLVDRGNHMPRHQLIPYSFFALPR